MITDSFRTDSEPVIALSSCHGPQQHLIDTCIVTFSHVIAASFKENYPCEEIAMIKTVQGIKPIYAFSHHGRQFGFYHSGIGSAMAGNDLAEVWWLTGAEKFIFFGSCGCLDSKKAQGKYVIPTAAYRDEGLSYHYAPPSDYIDMPGAERTLAFFRENHIPCVSGKVWTTDAFYRELRVHMEKRRAEGCLAVDMEAAGLQAVCSFHGMRLYYFLQCGDVLDVPEWDENDLSKANHFLDNFDIALKFAETL